MNFKEGDWIYHINDKVNGYVYKKNGNNGKILWEDGLFVVFSLVEPNILDVGRPFDVSVAYEKGQIEELKYKLDNLSFIEILSKLNEHD